MKKLGFYIGMSVLLTSCASSYNEIGGLGMLSDRHIDATQHYQKLAVAVGTSKKDIKHSKAISMKAAIDQVLNQVPGGEYITNVKVYAVNGDYLAVSGDVWGVAGNNAPAATPTDNTKVASITKTH